MCSHATILDKNENVEFHIRKLVKSNCNLMINFFNYNCNYNYTKTKISIIVIITITQKSVINYIQL